jgi:hypothetical protein
MSSRVSLPIASRLMGLAQPPRPSPLRVGPRGHAIRGGVTGTAPPSSHALVVRVRNLSAASLSPVSDFGLPCGRPRPRPLPKEPPYRSTPPSRLVRNEPSRSQTTSMRPLPSSSPRPLCSGSSPRLATRACCPGLRPLARPIHRVTPLLGPSDACQLARYVAACDPSRGSPRPAGFASPDSSRVANLPALFHAGTSMGTHPSEVSLRPRRPILSNQAVLPAVSRLAASRLRGFELR